MAVGRLDSSLAPDESQRGVEKHEEKRTLVACGRVADGGARELAFSADWKERSRVGADCGGMGAHSCVFAGDDS